MSFYKSLSKELFVVNPCTRHQIRKSVNSYYSPGDDLIPGQEVGLGHFPMTFFD